MADRRQGKKKHDYTDAAELSEKQASGFDSSSITLPEGVSLFGLKKEGTYRVDIIPYRVGEGNPNCPKPGRLHYERSYFTHRGIGPDERAYCCLLKTFHKPCPICEHRTKLAHDPDADAQLIKDLEPKHRQLWCVIDRTAGADPKKGVQVWDISFHLFGKLLAKTIHNEDEGDDYRNFFHLEDGLTLKLGAEEKKMGNTFYNVFQIEFKKRARPLDDELLDQAPCLDELIKEVPYKELKKIFLQVDNGEKDSEDEKPAKGKKTKPEPKEEPEDEPDEDEQTADDLGIEKGTEVTHDDHGLCTVVKVSVDGTTCRIKDEDGTVHTDVPVSELEVFNDAPEEDEEPDDEPEEEDEDEAPPPKKGKKGATSGKQGASKGKKKPEPEEDEDEEPEDDEDDWETDDEEEEEEEEVAPPPKLKKPAKKGKR